MNHESRFPTSPDPFVILAMPRTGSHYLETLLNEHPNVQSNGELLNSWDSGWPGADRTGMSDRDLLELAFVNFPVRDEKPKATSVGCKINEPQFGERPTFFEALAAWPRLKVVILQRRNLLESLRSFVQARQSRQWLAPVTEGPAPVPPSVKLSPATCESYFRDADNFYRRIFSSFPSEMACEVFYEDLLDSPEECMANLFDFLGVPPHLLSGGVVLQRQEMRPLSETVLNFDELFSYFRGSSYQCFFE